MARHRTVRRSTRRQIPPTTAADRRAATSHAADTTASARLTVKMSPARGPPSPTANAPYAAPNARAVPIIWNVGPAARPCPLLRRGWSRFPVDHSSPARPGLSTTRRNRPLRRRSHLGASAPGLKTVNGSQREDRPSRDGPPEPKVTTSLGLCSRRTDRPWRPGHRRSRSLLASSSRSHRDGTELLPGKRLATATIGLAPPPNHAIAWVSRVEVMRSDWCCATPVGPLDAVVDRRPQIQIDEEGRERRTSSHPRRVPRAPQR